MTDAYPMFRPHYAAIRTFCEITGDHNKLHSREDMGKAHKLPLVPGMLTFAYVASQAGGALQCARAIDIYFGAPLSEGDAFEARFHENGDGLRLAAIHHGEDVLRQTESFLDERGNKTARDLCSRLTSRATAPRMIKGIERIFEFEGGDLELFGSIVRGNIYSNDILFPIACVSNALLQTVARPLTGVEEQLYALAHDERRPLHPVYRSLHVALPEEKVALSYDDPLCFETLAEGTDRKTQFNFHVVCRQNGSTVYEATARVNTLPIYTLRQMAKPTSRPLREAQTP